MSAPRTRSNPAGCSCKILLNWSLFPHSNFRALNTANKMSQATYFKYLLSNEHYSC